MIKIHKAYKFRLYPTKEQKQMLLQHGGNTRFIWNQFLEINQQEYKNNQKFIFGYDLCNSIPKLKEEFEWLKISNAQSLQQVSRHFDQALKDVIKKTKGFPTFKSKNSLSDSFKIPQKFAIFKHSVKLPKIGKIKWVKHQDIKGKIKHLTITQDGDLWFCSVNVEQKVKQNREPINIDKVVGIDVGLKTFAYLSDNSKIENPRTLKQLEKKIKKAQRKMSRRVKGSKNRFKARLKLAKLHRKVKNQRNDFQHKVTHDMITKYQGFMLEDLNVKGMVKNHKLAKAISDVGWSSFKTKLKYKSDWNQKLFIEIGRFDATSKICCLCGWRHPNLTLEDRVFECGGCGLAIDRDFNAAINIKKIGLNIPSDNREFTLNEIGPLGKGVSPYLSPVDDLRKRTLEVNCVMG